MNEHTLSFPKLNDENWKTWRFSMDMLLVSKNLDDFTSDKEKDKAKTEGGGVENYDEYLRKSKKALAFICLSLTEEVKNIIFSAESSFDAWALLKSAYEPVSRARVAYLRRKFIQIKFNLSDTMSQYIGKVLDIVRDLEQTGKSVAKDEIAYQIIESLPPSYESLIARLYQLPDDEFNIEGIRPFLLAEYDRLQNKLDNQEIFKNSALVSSRTFPSTSSPEVCQNAMSTRVQQETRKCFRCGKVGHLVKYCRNKSRPRQQSSFKPRYRDSSRGSRMPHQVFFASALLTDGHEMEFILDSAATDHFSFDRTIFHNFRELESQAVIAKGTANICGIGDIYLQVDSGMRTKNFVLKNVYYVPDMVRNLVSVRKITNQGFKIKFEKCNSVIFNPDNSEFLRVPLVSKFYCITAKCIVNESCAYTIKSRNLNNCSNDLVLWHERFGHLNMRNLIKFSKSNYITGLKNLSGKLLSCEVCQLAKSTRESHYPVDEIKTNSVLELVHLDIWGPAPEPSLGDARFFLSLVDDFSRYSYVYILKHKGQAFEYFKHYKALVEKQTGHVIKRLRSDCGAEFCSKQFENYLSDEGIVHERTNTYSPQMNGIAERYNRTLMEGVRAILVQANLPLGLWAEIVCTVNYLKNRYPHTKLHGKAPLNVWRGGVFSVKHLKVIGSTVFIHVPKRYRNKLEKRSEKGILIGYARKTRGYRVWFPGTKDVKESKHVKIIENDFVSEPVKKLNDKIVWFKLSDEHIPDDPVEEDIFSGWKRVENIRKSGRSAGRIDVYYYPEPGTRLRSKNEVEEYCRKKGLVFKPEKFDFKSLKDNSVPPQPEVKKFPIVESTDEEEIDTDPEAHCANIKIPSNFKESQNLPEKDEWDQAMRSELKTLKDRHVFDLVTRPEKDKVLGTKWVYTIKRDVSGKIRSFKARLVAKGFRQVEGIDYFDTFSPVIAFPLVRFFFTVLVVLKGWLSQHIDVKGAYLYAKLSELIYVEQPDGFKESDGEKHVWKLNKALYGLHQAGREWFNELDKTFQDLNFDKILDCNCIYVYKSKVIVLVYVDDLAIFAENEDILNEVIQLIKSKFEIKSLGKIRNFLGVEFEQRGETYVLHQTKYIEKLADLFNVPKIRCKLPLTPGIVLNLANEGEDIDVPYRQLIGCLLFLASRSRPDIQFAVIALSQFSNKPSWDHWKNLCQVLQYIIDTKHLSLNLSRISSCNINVYTDATWASDIIDRKSISGSVIFIDHVPIFWNSSKQKCVALSSMESEYVALSDSVKELCWLTRIIDNFSFLNLDLRKPTIYCDNQSTICFSRNDVENSRTKYIDTRSYFVKENIGRFELKYISGKHNVADMMTKALPSDKFMYFRKWLLG